MPNRSVTHVLKNRQFYKMCVNEYVKNSFYKISVRDRKLTKVLFIQCVPTLKNIFQIGLFKMIFPQLPRCCALFPGIQHALCKLQISVQPQNIYKRCQGASFLTSQIKVRLFIIWTFFLIFK
jgi:hypothetical protein